MRVPVRSLATLLLSVGVATCSDAPHAPVKQPGAQARFALQPVFSREAAAVYARRATFAAANFDHVRIAIIRPPETIVRDTVITFNPSSPASLSLTVDVRSIGEVFTGVMEYTNNGSVVYRGQVRLVSHAPDAPAPSQQQVELVYVGPGANATRLVVAPKTVSLVAPATASFTATAFDANNGAIANVPLSWSSSDAAIAAVNPTTGAVTTGGKRGTATITAATPTGISDNATVAVTLPAAAIALVSGGGQTGKAGSALAQPAVVRVTASDGVGVAGVTVTFAPPAGGSVGSASVTTDAQGQASTTLTLGSTTGAQTFTASAAGFNVSIGATATPGDPTAITLVSGNGQQDTVRQVLKAPFVVKVADRFGNGVSGVTVTWSRTAGTGTLAANTSVTGSDGQATMTYTLGATIGVETVNASAPGVGSVTFTATTLNASAAAIAIVSGNSQTGRTGQLLSAPLVVRVTDAQGNPVPSVPVNWSVTNGTLVSGTATDPQGLSSNNLTLGTVVGTATATATVGSGANAKSVTFTATVLPGVARMLYEVPPTNVAAGAVMTPAVMVILLDAAGNIVSAPTNVSVALGANPGQATLSGTLTRVSSNGIALFNDLRVSAPGTGYTLIASTAGAPSITSAFNVTAPLPPVALQFVAQPGPVRVGASFSVQVRLLNVAGAPVPTATNTVTIAIGFNPANGILSGTRSVAAVNGVATFTGLSINSIGTGYSLVVSSPNLTSATSSAFSVTP